MLGMLLAAASAPTYLSCTLEREAAPLVVEIVANEDAQQAIVALPSTGRVVTRLAIFAPETVRIHDQEDVWVISRENLSLRRETTIGDQRFLDTGRCEVKPAPAERAF